VRIVVPCVWEQREIGQQSCAFPEVPTTKDVPGFPRPGLTRPLGLLKCWVFGELGLRILQTSPVLSHLTLNNHGVHTRRRFLLDPIGTNAGTLLREVMRRAPCAHELSDPRLPRKAPTELTAMVSTVLPGKAND
jgi:hypothetical protein